MTLDEYKKLNKERIEQGERELAAEEISCSCGKLLCKLSKSGRILVWCKECRKEVELELDMSFPNSKSITIPKIKLEVEPYEPVDKCKG